MPEDWSQMVQEWHQAGGKACLMIPWNERVEYKIEQWRNWDGAGQWRVVQTRVTKDNGSVHYGKARPLRRVLVDPLQLPK